MGGVLVSQWIITLQKKEKKRRSHRETPVEQIATIAEPRPPSQEESPGEELVSIMSPSDDFTDDLKESPSQSASPSESQTASPLPFAPMISAVEKRRLQKNDRHSKEHDPQRIYDKLTGALEKIPSVDTSLISTTFRATLTVQLEADHWVGYLTNIKGNFGWLLGASYSQEHGPLEIAQLIPALFKTRHQRWMDTLFRSTKGNGFETFAEQMLTKQRRLLNLQTLPEEASPYLTVFMDLTPIGLVPGQSFNFNVTFIKSEQQPRLSARNFFSTQSRNTSVAFKGEFETLPLNPQQQ